MENERQHALAADIETGAFGAVGHACRAYEIVGVKAVRALVVTAVIGMQVGGGLASETLKRVASHSADADNTGRAIGVAWQAFF